MDKGNPGWMGLGEVKRGEVSIAEDRGGVLWADEGEGTFEMHRGESAGEERNRSMVFGNPSEAEVPVLSVRRRGTSLWWSTKSPSFCQGPTLKSHGGDKARICL